MEGFFLSLLLDIVERMFDTMILEQVQGSDFLELEEMPSGILLGICLAQVDPTSLSGYDQIIYIRATQRMASYYQARTYAGMDAVAETFEQEEAGDLEFAFEGAAAEIRAALRLTRQAAKSELELAHTLRRRLPQVWKRLSVGALDIRRARTLAHGTEHLPIHEARSVVDQVIDRAGEFTTGQLGVQLRKACIAANPDEAKDRFEHAVDERRIILEPSTDGTAHLLGMDLPPDRAAAATKRINHLAQALRVGSGTRTMDQLRADVFLDLLCGTDQDPKGTKTAVVNINVDLETLARLNDMPGDLAGYGPVVADIARQVAEKQTDQSWRYTITNKDTGLPLDSGITRRRHNQRQRRITETLYPHCITPGCRAPATNCDIDHTKPWSEGGETSAENSGPLCRHDHTIKTNHGWTYQPTTDGDHIWTTKLGHTYTTSGRPP